MLAEMHMQICLYECTKIHLTHIYAVINECMYMYVYMLYGCKHLGMYIG